MAKIVEYEGLDLDTQKLQLFTKQLSMRMTWRVAENDSMYKDLAVNHALITGYSPLLCSHASHYGIENCLL